MRSLVLKGTGLFFRRSAFSARKNSENGKLGIKAGENTPFNPQFFENPLNLVAFGRLLRSSAKTRCGERSKKMSPDRRPAGASKEYIFVENEEVPMNCFERMRLTDSAPIAFATVRYGSWGARPKGIIFYSDGVLCTYERERFFEEEEARETITPVGFAPQMAGEVLNLIHEKEKVISQFPGELFGDALDAGYTEINFNGKTTV